MRRWQVLALTGFVVLCFIVSGVGGQVVNTPSAPVVQSPNQVVQTPQVAQAPQVTQPSAQQQSGSKMADIHDIKPLIVYKTTASLLFYLLIGAILLALMIAGYLYYKKRQKGKGEKSVPELSPDVMARKCLDGISDIRGITGRKFYFELSAIIRRYIQDQFKVMAVEMTTEELLPKVKTLELPSDMTGTLKKLLLFADPIKYAGASVSESRMQLDLDFAYSFVDQTMFYSTTQEKEAEGILEPAGSDG